MSKIIVIDGMDGSGKHTQASMLADRLSEKYDSVHMLSFPRYGETSEALVEMYLHGHINKDPMEVNPYAAAMCYALDRYISYERYWKDWLDDPESIIVFDRYISSNALHQAPKLRLGREHFISWVYDMENNMLGLPVPDIEIYLDVPTKKNMELLDDRYNNNDSLKDIHENISFQQICHDAFDNGRNTYFKNMKVVDCTDDAGNMRSKSDINDDIINLLVSYDVIY